MSYHRGGTRGVCQSRWSGWCRLSCQRRWRLGEVQISKVVGSWGFLDTAVAQTLAAGFKASQKLGQGGSYQWAVWPRLP